MYSHQTHVHPLPKQPLTKLTLIFSLHTHTLIFSPNTPFSTQQTLLQLIKRHPFTPSTQTSVTDLHPQTSLHTNQPVIPPPDRGHICYARLTGSRQRVYLWPVWSRSYGTCTLYISWFLQIPADPAIASYWRYGDTPSADPGFSF
jgi:hypothetical protein